LNNNDIRSLTGLSGILDNVMYFPDRLQSLNLSHNYLERVDTELLNFPNLKCLYLHGNYISNLEEIRKLGKLHTLQILTLYANSIAQIKGYRLYCLGIMYSECETLKKFDSVLVTQHEFNSVLVWNERLFESQ
jgi:Leucine-rich repeat (LRR) protein